VPAKDVVKDQLVVEHHPVGTVDQGLIAAQ
jgi:hypothetical protein